MASKKNTTTSTAAAPKAGFTPSALAAKVGDRLDPAKARTAILERIDQNQKVAMVAVERVASVIDKVTPNVSLPSLPKFPRVEAAIRENVEFARTVVRKQTEFAEQAARKLVAAARNDK